jgi:hypothetical protein
MLNPENYITLKIIRLPVMSHFFIFLAICAVYLTTYFLFLISWPKRQTINLDADHLTG